MLKPIAISALVLVASCSGTKKESITLPKTIEESVQSSLRTPENTFRDQYRHPVETLKFFGLENTMTVIEIQPGAGWYLEILAPFLAQNGKYIMANPAVNPAVAYQVKNSEKIKAFVESYPVLSKSVSTTSFDAETDYNMGPENSVDMILTFRNAHNWFKNKQAEKVFKSVFKTLKPGGVFGFVDHRENPYKFDPEFKSGYVREKEVIKLTEKVGFKVAAKSEINANPKDRKNHPNGVWTLPPSLALGDKDRAKYIEIGESDRMTIKFVKPVK